MHDIFVDTDIFPLPLTFLGPHRHRGHVWAFRRGMDVGKTERGKSVIVMQLEPDPGK